MDSCDKRTQETANANADGEDYDGISDKTGTSVPSTSFVQDKDPNSPGQTVMELFGDTEIRYTKEDEELDRRDIDDEESEDEENDVQSHVKKIKKAIKPRYIQFNNELDELSMEIETLAADIPKVERNSKLPEETSYSPNEKDVKSSRSQRKSSSPEEPKQQQQKQVSVADEQKKIAKELLDLMKKNHLGKIKKTKFKYFGKSL